MALKPAAQDTISLTPLSDEVIAKLRSIPEQGMGYQVVNLVTNSGKIIERVIVLQGAHAMIPTIENIHDGSEIVDVIRIT